MWLGVSTRDLQIENIFFFWHSKIEENIYTNRHLKEPLNIHICIKEYIILYILRNVHFSIKYWTTKVWICVH